MSGHNGLLVRFPARREVDLEVELVLTALTKRIVTEKATRAKSVMKWLAQLGRSGANGELVRPLAAADRRAERTLARTELPDKTDASEIRRNRDNATTKHVLFGLLGVTGIWANVLKSAIREVKSGAELAKMAKSAISAAMVTPQKPKTV